MEHIKVVIGANYGDEGKGSVTSHLTQWEDSPVLNVLFNGGIQRGHTAHDHVFHCFGAGTLDGASTYYDKNFMFNPTGWREECEQLGFKPDLYIHPEATIITPFDMLINRALEKKRDSKRHGSCGMGIYETARRNLRLPIYAKDLFREYELYNKLRYVQRIYGKIRCDELGLEEYILKVSVDQFMVDAYEMAQHCKMKTFDEIKDDFKTVIFEGAQGLALDKDNLKDYPYLTPSHTGSTNILPYIYDAPLDVDKEIWYVTRSYVTRHGNGPLPFECNKEDINPNIVDKTNEPNDYQGSIRYGYFDVDGFMGRVENDWKNYEDVANVKQCIAITHCDYTYGLMCIGKKDCARFHELTNNQYSKVYGLIRGRLRYECQQ